MLTNKKLPIAFSGLSNEKYHEMEGLSSTQLTTIADKSLKHLLNQKRKDSSAKDFGTFIHAAILEPEKIEDEFIYTDESAPPRNTKIGKDEFKLYIESHDTAKEDVKSSDDWQRAWFGWKYPGKKPISKDWQDRKNAILALLDKHPSRDLIKLGYKELSIFWEENISDKKILLKAKPDILHTNNMLIDIKTTEDASEKGVNKSISKFNYHWSLTYHARGIEALTGQPVPALGWLFIEKEAPHAFNLIQMPDDMRESANDCIDAVLLKYVSELKTIDENDFPYGKSWSFARHSLWMSEEADRIK